MYTKWQNILFHNVDSRILVLNICHWFWGEYKLGALLELTGHPGVLCSHLCTLRAQVPLILLVSNPGHVELGWKALGPIVRTNTSDSLSGDDGRGIEGANFEFYKTSLIPLLSTRIWMEFNYTATKKCFKTGKERNLYATVQCCHCSECCKPGSFWLNGAVMNVELPICFPLLQLPLVCHGGEWNVLQRMIWRARAAKYKVTRRLSQPFMSK